MSTTTKDSDKTKTRSRSKSPNREKDQERDRSRSPERGLIYKKEVSEKEKKAEKRKFEEQRISQLSKERLLDLWRLVDKEVGKRGLFKDDPPLPTTAADSVGIPGKIPLEQRPLTAQASPVKDTKQQQVPPPPPAASVPVAPAKVEGTLMEYPNSKLSPHFKGKTFKEATGWKEYVGTFYEKRAQESKAERNRPDYLSMAILDSGFFKVGDPIAICYSNGIEYGKVIELSHVFIKYKISKFASIHSTTVEDRNFENSYRASVTWLYHMNPRPCPVPLPASS